MNSARTGADSKQWLEDALHTLAVLFEPGDVIEIRALDVFRTQDRSGRIYGGYFEFGNKRAIAHALQKLDGKAQGVYIVLNRFRPELLARSNNRLQASPQHTTSDADIIEWRWLYIDVDAIRPAGISATEEQHQTTLLRTNGIQAFLDDLGWPEPIAADSGNGAHLLYRLPALDLKCAANLVRRSLKALSARFSDELVKVDESTGNAARLGRLYGTLTRKGDSTPDRPHRRSSLLKIPERIVPVPLKSLESLASEAVTADTSGKKTSAAESCRIDEWLAQSDLEIIKGPEDYHGGRRWTLQLCPFNPEHAKPVVIELASGALVFKCLHTSCSENNWEALRRYVQPDFREPTSLSVSLASNGCGRSTDPALAITDLSQIPSVFSFESRLDWCVETMIARGSITLISAESGTGKTWFGYYIAGCVARGVPVLDRPTKACKVLYLDGENPLYVVKQRLLDLGIGDTPNLIAWGGWNHSPPVGPNHPLVVQFARQQQGLIVFDSLIEFHTGSEQSSTETRGFMRHFRTLANLGASLVILHHTGKAESSKQYRGSSDIKAAVDTAYLLARASQNSDELGVLSMTCFKARLAPGRNFGMQFKKGQGFVAREGIKSIRSVEEIVTKILAAEPKTNQGDIIRLAQEKGCSKLQIEDCLKTGPWSRQRGLKNAILYSLPVGRLDQNESEFKQYPVSQSSRS